MSFKNYSKRDKAKKKNLRARAGKTYDMGPKKGSVDAHMKRRKQSRGRK